MRGMLISCGDFAERGILGLVIRNEIVGGRIPGFIRTTDSIGALCGVVRVNFWARILFAVMVGVWWTKFWM